jgi:glutamate-1-semialdehyde 2,1-aminomutase
MTLCCPHTSAADVDKLIATLDTALAELLAIPGARESVV